MPRVSIRKLFLYILIFASLLLLAINVHQRGSSLFGLGLGGIDFQPPQVPALRDGDSVIVASVKTSTEYDAQISLSQSPENQFQDTKVKQMVPPKYKALDGSLLDPNDLRIPDVQERPWYMKDGLFRPTHSKNAGYVGLHPEDAPGHDRIPDQLMFIPPRDSFPVDPDSPDAKLKKILLWNGINSWGGLKPGRGVFIKEQCPVSTCAIVSNRIEAAEADMILFKDHFTMPTIERRYSQIWMLYLLECPLHTQVFKQKSVFNWTATYRSDSTIVAPYERWQYYNNNVRGQVQPRDYAVNKTKAVAWFVSNCGARNGRLNYAKELQKYIQVDIYGSCGTKLCPRSQSDQCFKILNRDYKFYLAFENSNCIDYITEKFFVNGLMNDLVPIVMGARPQDYARSAPYHSFIHVDDFESPKELASYLHKLDQDDNLYNEYFRWKGTGEFINTKFYCRVCAMLHEQEMQRSSVHIKDINEWWRGKGTCINTSWRKTATEKKVSHGITTLKSSNQSVVHPQEAPPLLNDDKISNHDDTYHS